VVEATRDATNAVDDRTVAVRAVAFQPLKFKWFLEKKYIYIK
jgi:hypothetical protein